MIFNVKVAKNTWTGEYTVKFPLFKKSGNILPLMFRHVTRKSHLCMISRLMSTLYVVTLAVSSNQKPVSRSHDLPRTIWSLSRVWPPAPTLFIHAEAEAQQLYLRRRDTGEPISARRHFETVTTFYKVNHEVSCRGRDRFQTVPLTRR